MRTFETIFLQMFLDVSFVNSNVTDVAQDSKMSAEGL